MKLAVQINHLVDQILYRSLEFKHRTVRKNGVKKENKIRRVKILPGGSIVRLSSYSPSLASGSLQAEFFHSVKFMEFYQKKFNKISNSAPILWANIWYNIIANSLSNNRSIIKNSTKSISKGIIWVTFCKELNRE